jgi:hypothetical protein
MATAQEYAQWIVNNQDKQGTVDFQTVSQAYEQAKQQEYAAMQQQAAEQPDVPVLDWHGNLVSPPQQPIVPEQEPTLGEKLTGAAETGLTMATGATGGTAGMIYGALTQLAQEIASGKYGTKEAADRVEQEAMRMAGELTYAPRTETGQEYLQEVGEALAPLAPLAGMTGELQIISNAAQMSSPVLRDFATRTAAQVKEKVPTPSARMTDKSVGAARIPQEQIRAQKAEALPVPVKLTKGAAGREAEQLAFEKETMKSPEFGAPLRARAEENNLQALQNFDALIDMTAAQEPDIAGTGNAVIKALSQGYKQAKNKTRVAYKAARESDEALTPVDTAKVVTVGPEDDLIQGTIWDYINSKPRGVESSKVTDSARATALKLGVAAEDADGNLIPKEGVTLGKMEDFRRELSGMANLGDRTGLRDETILKNLVDATTEEAGGTLYKTARSLRKEQARKYENRAIVARLVTNVRGMDDPKVAADQVFKKSILNSSPEEITFMKRVLQTSGEDGQQAWKELQGATARHIMEQATKGMGMDSADNPIVSPAQLHRVVSQLDANDRLDLIFGKKQGAIIRDLNDVVRYVNTVPPGTLINNSGTAGMILAAIGEAGTYGATTGVPVPVITGLKWLRDRIKDNQIKKKVDSALAGLEKEKK